jgi:transposase-like protein
MKGPPFMPQVQLPIFPPGSLEINPNLGVLCDHHTVTYYNGHLPVFSHAVEDLSSFRMFTSQLIANGSAHISDIVRAFGVSPTTVKRALRLFREQGVRRFFVKSPPRRGHRLTPETLLAAQRALNEGVSVPEVAEQTGVLTDTLRKAIQSHRLSPPAKKKR